MEVIMDILNNDNVTFTEPQSLINII